MKKWTAFVLALMLAFILIGCKDEPPVDETVKPNHVTITGDKTVIDVDEELQLTAAVTPEGVEQTVVWTSNDTDVVTVDNNGKIKGKDGGSATIKATSTVDSRIYGTYNIEVKEPIVYDPPTNVEISAFKAEVSIGSFITLTATVFPTTASQEVIYSSNDEGVATVSADGKVKGIAKGTAFITATVVADNSLADTYQVTVIEFEDPSDLSPESILISGETEVNEGKTIMLTASVLPTGTSQNVIWSVDDEEIATISIQGQLTALKAGVVYVTATSSKDTTVTAVKKVTVKVPPEKEPYPNLNGYSIKIMGSTGHTNEHDPFDEGYAGTDKLAKQEAWSEVERLFNCKFEVVEYPPEAPWGPVRVSWLVEKAALNQSQADIIVSSTEWLKPLVDGNAVVDTTDFYDWYGENQMAAALKQASTFKGGLYALMIPNVGGINVDKGLYYNVALVENLNLESPAKLFNEGR